MYVNKTVDAQNKWTDPLIVPCGQECWGRGHFNISIKPSSAVMTITLQRKYKEETTWGHEVELWVLTTGSTDYEFISEHPEPEQVEYRIGCATGDYTSGSCVVRMGLHDRQYS